MKLTKHHTLFPELELDRCPLQWLTVLVVDGQPQDQGSHALLLALTWNCDLEHCETRHSHEY